MIWTLSHNMYKMLTQSIVGNFNWINEYRSSSLSCLEWNKGLIVIKLLILFYVYGYIPCQYSGTAFLGVICEVSCMLTGRMHIMYL